MLGRHLELLQVDIRPSSIYVDNEVISRRASEVNDVRVSVFVDGIGVRHGEQTSVDLQVVLDCNCAPGDWSVFMRKPSEHWHILSLALARQNVRDVHSSALEFAHLEVRRKKHDLLSWTFFPRVHLHTSRSEIQKVNIQSSSVADLYRRQHRQRRTEHRVKEHMKKSHKLHA